MPPASSLTGADAEPAPRTPRADVRRRILAAAESEFAARGYADASLATIARRAGFTKGAVYSNFESKQALLADVLARRAVAVIDRALTALAAENDDVDSLAERAGDALAGELEQQADWHLLTADLAVQAARDPLAAQAYGRLRAEQLTVLRTTLRERSSALGLPGTAVDHAAVVLLTVTNALAVERAANPSAWDRAAVAAVLRHVVAGLIPTTVEEQT